MRVVFRTDASLQIGTGHVMRCLTLAEALQEAGAQCHFICREHPGNLIAQIRLQGFSVSVLPVATEAVIAGERRAESESNYAAWLGVDWDIDAAQTKVGVGETAVEWLIIDHYALDARWEKVLRPMCRHLMVIDDIANRLHDCDVLLDQNYYADMQTRYIGKVPLHCQLLLGPRYALLREEFRKLREQVTPRTGEVKKILVFFGGVDAGNYSSLAIQALTELNTAMSVDVVIGAQHPYRKQIQNVCIERGYICHVQTTRMAELMAEADLAIGAGGSATWERCCLGLPCIVLAVANNQVQAAKDISITGAVNYIGVGSDVTIEKMKRSIVDCCNQDWLNKASLHALGLLDSKGVFRVINILGEV